MELLAAAGLKGHELLFVGLAIAIALCSSLAMFLACLYWFRREQRRWQKKFLIAVVESGRDTEQLILTDGDAVTYGELVAQFKVDHGKRVVSVLESDGRRFLHVDGELSPNERTKMVHYLKSEGFMS